MASGSGSYPRLPVGEGSHPPPASLDRERKGLTNVLVVGGTAARREQVARAFHRESPLRDGPFVCVDCSREEDRLRAALQGWMRPGEALNPYRAAERGTLYLDSVAHLSADTQSLLLALARRLLGQPVDAPEPGCAARLVVGNPTELGEAVSGGRFMAALCDALDKVRVQLETAAPGNMA